jgi:putative nucleotidyltransferase with HDIG domain
MSDPTIQKKVDDIFALYEKHGAEEYYGEAVSQLEHMCQSAELARIGGYDDEVVLAAFFHDIGYLIHSENKDTMGSFGRKNHEKEAGAFLRRMGFSDKVASLTEQHVNAKRYLTFADPGILQQAIGSEQENTGVSRRTYGCRRGSCVQS